MMVKYTYNYFKESMPEWKKRKDPINCRYVIRPLSFYGSAFCANHGISANVVSYFSAIVAIIGCACFLIDNKTINIIGAILMNVWLWLDCVDGNIARSVKKEPFGAFADSLSSYTLVALMCTCMGVCAYHNNGILVGKGTVWLIILGSFASTFDTLTRLVNQKYKNSEIELIEQGVLEKPDNIDKEHNEEGNLAVRLEEALGIGGWLPHFILLAVIFDCVDIIIFYCFLFYGSFFAIGMLMNVGKAIKKQHAIELNANK